MMNIQLSFSGARELIITECEYKDLQIALGKVFVSNRSQPVSEGIERYGCFDGASRVAEPEINWQGLYQRTEDALLALRVELGGKDYKTHAIDHVAAIRYLLKEGAALSPARSGEPLRRCSFFTPQFGQCVYDEGHKEGHLYAEPAEG